MKAETHQGILRKFGVLSTIAIGLFLISKKHTALRKDQRHRRETDACVDSEEYAEFGHQVSRPGFPANNPTLDYDEGSRSSKYQGSGSAWGTRARGDRLSMQYIVETKLLGKLGGSEKDGDH